MFSHRIRTFLIIVLAAISLTLPAEAQESPMSAPRVITVLQDSFNGGSVTIIPMADAGDGINISAYTMEGSEPGVSCAAAIMSHSAWFKIMHPGGTLDINTAYATGTGFDSVVQLFADDTGNVAALNELGCDNDSGGGSSANDARLIMPNLPSASYIIRILCIGLCGGTSDLALSVSYTPNEPGPANDAVSAAKAITIGKADVVQSIEHASVAATENTLLGCTMNSTVWYRMIVPISGAYAFSSFGSVLNRLSFNPADTKLAVYVSSGGPIFTNFTEEGCSDDYGSGIGYGALPSIELIAGDEVYVRVGSFSSFNLLDGSYYRLKVSIVNLVDVLVNDGFETGLLAPWSMKVTSALDGVTNAYSYLGNYSARMVGGPNKVNKLKQKWSVVDMKLANDSSVYATFSYSTNATVSDNAVASLKMTFTNGALPQVIKQKLISETAAGSFKQVYLQMTIKPAKLKDITLMIKNKSSGGQLFIDTATVRIFGDPTRDTKQAPDVLPLPEAPTTMRGTN